VSMHPMHLRIWISALPAQRNLVRALFPLALERLQPPVFPRLDPANFLLIVRPPEIAAPGIGPL
jgi:hypothetical protein